LVVHCETGAARDTTVAGQRHVDRQNGLWVRIPLSPPRLVLVLSVSGEVELVKVIREKLKISEDWLSANAARPCTSLQELRRTFL
jgi:hypothetical protein